jgi:cell wall-associated NlpC family hydrolase
MVSVRKIATCLLVGTLIFTWQTGTAKASETPVAGIDLSLSEINLNSQEVETEIQPILLSKTKEQDANLAFAKVRNYVNIRSKASENSKILGKLYKENAATILKKKDGWYQVTSGAVTGYIKANYLVTGKKAEELAEKVGTTMATVNTTTLKVREKASETSSVLTLVPNGEDYKVTKEKEDWVKILIDETISGYVSKDFVELNKVYKEAISIEEEKALLAERESTSGRSAKSSSNETKSLRLSSSADSSIRQNIVGYALKFEGNPYVWGGTSLTRGADCSGYTQSLFDDLGINIPRTSREQAASGRRIDIDDIQPGDLIFYSRNGTINHVALYIGNGKVIGASSRSEGIRIKSYNYRTPYKAVSYID